MKKNRLLRSSKYPGQHLLTGSSSTCKRTFVTAAICLFALTTASAQVPADLASKPWMNKSLDASKRAALLLPEMTLDEKLLLLHGVEANTEGSVIPTQTAAKITSGAVGYLPSIDRLGIPALQIADAAVGVTKGGKSGRYSTPMPSAISEASAWDNDLSFAYGSLLGRELRDAGFNMSLAGGVNIARDPRNGRNFEYLGEDPILAGTLVGEEAKGVQSQGVIGDIKHFAINDQEEGRTTINVKMDRRTMRETDLLAFEIGIRNSGVSSVMCAYNRVNDNYACENAELLKDLLKRDFNFQGFVISDWKATHSTVKAANAGLDMEMPDAKFFGDALRKSIDSGEVSKARIDDMVRRILRAEFAAGLFDRKPHTQVTDVEAGMATAQRVAEEGTVLLKNDHVLPLQPAVRSVLLIGGHSDVGVITGGGSSKVDGPGGSAVPAPTERSISYFHSSPLEELKSRLPKSDIRYNSGEDIAAAAAQAKSVDVPIVFAVQYSREDRDVPSLSLPDHQDDLIAAIAAANPHTIVVLETGTPVTMPWLPKVAAVMEAWYPGIHGAQAIARIITGEISPSGKLPITFPASEKDLPREVMFNIPDTHDVAPEKGVADASYTEGLKVGYKWYDAEHKTPLFPFGFGLTYTTFAYSNLRAVMQDGALQVRVTVQNTGDRAATEVAEIYASVPDASEPPHRLIAWERVALAPHESRQIQLKVEPMLLSIFDTRKNGWQLLPGSYTIYAGGSSRDLPLHTDFQVHGNEQLTAR